MFQCRREHSICSSLSRLSYFSQILSWFVIPTKYTKEPAKGCYIFPRCAPPLPHSMPALYYNQSCISGRRKEPSLHTFGLWNIGQDARHRWRHLRNRRWHDPFYTAVKQDMELSEALWNKVLPCDRVNEKYVLNGIHFEGLSELFRNSICLFKRSKDLATVQDMACHAASITKLQHGSPNTETPCYHYVAYNTRGNQGCRGRIVNIIKSFSLSSNRLSLKSYRKTCLHVSHSYTPWPYGLNHPSIHWSRICCGHQRRQLTMRLLTAFL